MLLSALSLAVAVVGARAQTASSFPVGVIATGTMGTTNPPQATMPTIINQGSMARLLSINSIDDFCLFAPPDPNSVIADTEQEEVAWCTQPRNNARVIPDGVITGVSFLRTDFYVQLMGTGDFTQIGIQNGDEGGELDPHGATGAGNPIGGNITTTIADGTDEHIAEWMEYISYNQFCIRACTWANSTYSAAAMCWHELDVMGCEFVMPGTYNAPGIFETCDADVAYPPGWYPEVENGVTSYSSFAQYFTGVYTGGDGSATPYTVGDLVTPSTVAFIPSSSNCVTQATISNGIAASLLTAGASGTAVPAGFTSTPTTTGGTAPTALNGGDSNSSSGSGPGTTTGTTKLATSTTAKATTPGTGAPGTTPATSAGSSTVSGSSPARRGVSVGYGDSGEFAAVALVSLVSGIAAVALLA
ncbi:hypothetical protein HMN09_00781600 [Mycena chlorophos]|uniref:Uncharacterized protein n=1 Tax=Mycena chlorophos TaxID=658473 RepID=A0A8H6SU47_MYCCL|nr:hypothetical protein HMN09_00781600 [Mycena chlorophos]